VVELEDEMVEGAVAVEVEVVGEVACMEAIATQHWYFRTENFGSAVMYFCYQTHWN